MIVNEIKVLSFDYKNLLYKVRINGAEKFVNIDTIMAEIMNNVIGVIDNTLKGTNHYTYATIRGLLEEVDEYYSHHRLKEY